MEIHSDRRHAFPVPPDELWQAMERVDAYAEWWPWLHGFEADALAPGERWSAVVQPPLPYRLRFELLIHEVEPPHHVCASVTGDITGSARLWIDPVATGSELHLSSTLSPASSVLRAVASVAPLVARFGHDRVLDIGLRQFRERALP